jgi:hypothetical protein
MVPTDDGGHIPGIYRELVVIVSKDEVETLPPDQSTDHAIVLETGNHLAYGGIYNLSDFEMRTLKDYIKPNHVTRFIQQSSLLATAPMLLAKKKDRGLGLCVDYRALNLATVKNR